MKRTARRFVCAECGRPNLRWEGRCPGCGAWNTLEPDQAPSAKSPARSRFADPAAGPVRLGDAEAVPAARRATGMEDVDRVLGGGFASGTIALLAGAPGIGKSTLLLQVASRLAADGATVLYVSGEESVEQVRQRAGRLGGGADDVLFLPDTRAEAIVEAASACGPALLCVDSIQTAVTDTVGSAAGSVPQVRESASLLQSWTKRTGTPTVLVGHVTKGGGLAGPRTLEHLVDVVLWFEGVRGEDARVLRATKNRFGRVGELAVFRMEKRGLVPVPDPGTAILADRAHGPGSALTVALEGSRPLVLEVQALSASAAQGPPRRMTTGFSPRRLAMLLAVLERRGGVPLDRSDVYVNVVGGLRISDPAGDAGVVAALASSELDRVIPESVAFLGEAGLSGELRGVGEREQRMRELARVGIRDVVLPAAGSGRAAGAHGVRVHEVSTVRALVEWIAGHGSRAAS